MSLDTLKLSVYLPYTRKGNVVLALQSAYFSTLARSMQVHLGRSLFVTRAAEEPEDHKERLRDIATRKSSCMQVSWQEERSRRVSTHFGLTESTTIQRLWVDYGYAIYERISILLNKTEDGILHGSTY